MAPAGPPGAPAPVALPPPLLPPPLPPYVPVEAAFDRSAQTAELSFALPPAQADWRVVGWRRDASGALKLVLQPPPGGGSGAAAGAGARAPPPLVALAHPSQQAPYAAAVGANAAAAGAHAAAVAAAGRLLAVGGGGGGGGGGTAAQNAAAATAAAAAAAALPPLPTGIYPPLSGCAASVLALAPCGLSPAARAWASARGLTSVAAVARTTHAAAVSALGAPEAEALTAALHAFAQGAWRARAWVTRRRGGRQRAECPPLNLAPHTARKPSPAVV
jgi:hypothetical protein